MFSFFKNGGCGLTLFVLVILALLGSSLYLDSNGLLAPGVVTDKSEYVYPDKLGGYNRDLQLAVRYTPQGDRFGKLASLRVDAATYDRLHKDSPVMVRYLPENEILGFFWPLQRLDGQNTFSLWPWDFIRPVALVVSGLVLLYFWFKARAAHNLIENLLLVPLLAAWVIAMAVVFVLPAVFPRDLGPLQSGTAKIINMTSFTQIGGGNRSRPDQLLQPYRQVQLQFVPAGYQDPVIAVDGSDEGSIPNMIAGNTVDITYPQRDPRQAEVAGGRLRHRQ